MSRTAIFNPITCGVQVPARSFAKRMVTKMGQAMMPNDERPCLEQQKFIVLAINVLGFEPFEKPIHLYSLDELKEIQRMYMEVVT